MFIVTVNILKGSLTDSALNLSHRQVFALVVPFAVAHVAEGLETLELQLIAKSETKTRATQAQCSCC